MPSLDLEALRLLALPLLLVAPFPVYVKLRNELKEARRINWEASYQALLDFKFGEINNLTIAQQWELVTEEFEKYEREILDKDFSHKHEMMLIKEIVLRLGAKMYGTSTGPYAHWRERIAKIVEAIHRHDEEKRNKDRD